MAKKNIINTSELRALRKRLKKRYHFLHSQNALIKFSFNNAPEEIKSKYLLEEYQLAQIIQTYDELIEAIENN